MRLRAAYTSQGSPRREGGRIPEEGVMVILSGGAQGFRQNTKGSIAVKVMEYRSWAYSPSLYGKTKAPSSGRNNPSSQLSWCYVLDTESWTELRQRNRNTRPGPANYEVLEPGIESRQSDPRIYTSSFSKTLSQYWHPGQSMVLMSRIVVGLASLARPPNASSTKTKDGSPDPRRGSQGFSCFLTNSGVPGWGTRGSR